MEIVPSFSSKITIQQKSKSGNTVDGGLEGVLKKKGISNSTVTSPMRNIQGEDRWKARHRSCLLGWKITATWHG